MKEKSTILIVDDSELNRTVLADILGDEYNFIEAENVRTRNGAAAERTPISTLSCWIWSCRR